MDIIPIIPGVAEARTSGWTRVSNVLVLQKTCVCVWRLLPSGHSPLAHIHTHTYTHTHTHTHIPDNTLTNTGVRSPPPSPTTQKVMVSHDSGFLDRVTTNILHYEDNRKLRNYKGNLGMFVKRVPRAKTYYELSEENLSFSFPEPGLLDGVKSKYVLNYTYTHVLNYTYTHVERWGAGVEIQKNVRKEIGGWGRVPFNEPYAPLLSTIYDGA